MSEWGGEEEGIRRDQGRQDPAGDGGEGLPALPSGPLATDAAADPCGTLLVVYKMSIDLSRTEHVAWLSRHPCVEPFLLPHVFILRLGLWGGGGGGVTVAPHKGNRSNSLTATITMPDHAPPPKHCLHPKSSCHLGLLTFSFYSRGWESR